MEAIGKNKVQRHSYLQSDCALCVCSACSKIDDAIIVFFIGVCQVYVP